MRRPRPWIVPVVLAASIVAIAVVASGRTPAFSTIPRDRLITSGLVHVDEVVVTAPSVTYPAPDVAVGVRSGPAVTPSAPSGRPMAANGLPVVAGSISTVPVTLASEVTTGQLLAAFDDRMLRLALGAARLRARQSRDDVRAIDDALEELETKQHDLDVAREKLASGLAKALSARRQALAQLALLRKLIASIPAVPPSLPPSLPLPPPGPDPRVLEAKLLAGLAKLDAGLAQARAAGAKLASAQAKLDDARTTLRNLKPLMRALVGLADAGVELTAAEVGRARVLSPVSGLVLDRREAGEIAMVGSPIATIRRAGALEVRAYLAAADAARVSLGSAASVTVDSRPGEVFSGSVTRMGDEYVFPPTDHPTSEIHPDRAVLVVVTLAGSPGLPPGTWADVELRVRP